MSLDAALIEAYTQGINAPSVGDAGKLAVAAGTAGSMNLTYVDQRLVANRPPKLGTDLTDANATIQVSQGNRRTVPAATLTANRQVTLSATGATSGEVIVIDRLGTEAFTLAIINGGPGAGTKYTFPSGVARLATFTFDGTNWSLNSHWAI
jgi:hypothetical protein